MLLIEKIHQKEIPFLISLQAETNRAQLVVVEFIEELPRDMQKLIVVITPLELQKRVTQERRKQLECLVAPI